MRDAGVSIRTLTIVDATYMEAVYVDGKLADQADKITMDMVAELFGYKVEHKRADYNRILSLGGFPENLEEIP